MITYVLPGIALLVLVVFLSPSFATANASTLAQRAKLGFIAAAARHRRAAESEAGIEAGGSRLEVVDTPTAG